jgi:hypothetical protein
MDIYDELARLPGIRAAFVEVAKKDEAAVSAHVQAAGCSCIDWYTRSSPQTSRPWSWLLFAKHRPPSFRKLMLMLTM